MLRTGQTRAEIRAQPLYETNHDLDVLLKPTDA